MAANRDDDKPPQQHSVQRRLCTQTPPPQQNTQNLGSFSKVIDLERGDTHISGTIWLHPRGVCSRGDGKKRSKMPRRVVPLFADNCFRPTES